MNLATDRPEVWRGGGDAGRLTTVESTPEAEVI
jgi:hypothetical protein